jgi:hypothetical protein
MGSEQLRELGEPSETLAVSKIATAQGFLLGNPPGPTTVWSATRPLPKESVVWDYDAWMKHSRWDDLIVAALLVVAVGYAVLQAGRRPDP